MVALSCRCSCATCSLTGIIPPRGHPARRTSPLTRGRDHRPVWSSPPPHLIPRGLAFWDSRRRRRRIGAHTGRRCAHRSVHIAARSPTTLLQVEMLVSPGGHQRDDVFPGDDTTGTDAAVVWGPRISSAAATAGSFTILRGSQSQRGHGSRASRVSSALFLSTKS